VIQELECRAKLIKSSFTIKSAEKHAEADRQNKDGRNGSTYSVLVSRTDSDNPRTGC
jgi:hypothetical protein